MKSLCLAFTLTSLLLAYPASAATQWYTATVDRVLVDGRPTGVDSLVYGGCAAKVTPDASTILAGCGSSYVSFSCSGDFNSKSTGTNKFNLAQLAFITGQRVELNINDTKLHNGQCYVEALNVKP